jgi:hypothetical protein
MVFTLLALLAGVTIGLVTGGRPRNLTDHHVLGWWLLLPGFAFQMVANQISLHTLGTAILLVGYGLLLTFVAVNRGLIGIFIVAVGLAANALVIGLNGGMPVRSSAVVSAGIADQAGVTAVNYGHRHHLETNSDVLPWLGDIIPLPTLHQVISFGDLILAVGVTDVAAHLLHRRPGRPVRRPQTGKYQKGLLRSAGIWWRSLL